MKRKNLFITLSILLLVPTFLVRPIVIDAQSGPQYSAIRQKAKSLSVCSLRLSNPHSVFRHIERESRDVTVHAPEVAKAKAPSLLEDRRYVVLDTSSPSPKSFFILRI